MLNRDLKAEEYCISKSSVPSQICEELFDYTVKNVKNAGMLIGPLGASVLRFLIGTVSAKKVLEVGCYTGYSALAMAEVLPKDGKLITLDISAETTKVGQEFWKK